MQRKRGTRRGSCRRVKEPWRWNPRPGLRWATQSGQGQKGGRNREGRTDSTDVQRQRMRSVRASRVQAGKSRNHGTSATETSARGRPALTSGQQGPNTPHTHEATVELDRKVAGTH